MSRAYDTRPNLEGYDALTLRGISKFVLRPIAESDEDLLAQSRRLTEEVIPLFMPSKAAFSAAG